MSPPSARGARQPRSTRRSEQGPIPARWRACPLPSRISSTSLAFRPRPDRKSTPRGRRRAATQWRSGASRRPAPSSSARSTWRNMPTASTPTTRITAARSIPMIRNAPPAVHPAARPAAVAAGLVTLATWSRVSISARQGSRPIIASKVAMVIVVTPTHVPSFERHGPPLAGCQIAQYLTSAQTLIKQSKLVLLAYEICLRLCCVAAISFLAVPGVTTEAR